MILEVEYHIAKTATQRGDLVIAEWIGDKRQADQIPANVLQIRAQL
jgi:hypothetical protein